MLGSMFFRQVNDSSDNDGIDSKSFASELVIVLLCDGLLAIVSLLNDRIDSDSDSIGGDSIDGALLATLKLKPKA